MTLREEIEKMYDSKHYGAPRYDEIETLVNDQITSFAERVRLHIPRTAGVPVTDPTMKSCNEAHDFIDKELEALRGSDE